MGRGLCKDFMGGVVYCGGVVYYFLVSSVDDQEKMEVEIFRNVKESEFGGSKCSRDCLWVRFFFQAVAVGFVRVASYLLGNDVVVVTFVFGEMQEVGFGMQWGE